MEQLDYHEKPATFTDNRLEDVRSIEELRCPDDVRSIARERSRVPPVMVLLLGLLLVSAVVMATYCLLRMVTLEGRVDALELRLARLERGRVRHVPGEDYRYDEEEYQWDDEEEEEEEEEEEGEEDSIMDYDEDGDAVYDVTMQKPDLQLIKTLFGSKRPKRDTEQTEGRGRTKKNKKRKNKKKKNERAVKCIMDTYKNHTVTFKKSAEQCHASMEQYIQAVLAETLPMTPIHLEAKYPELDGTDQSQLDNDEKIALPALGGELFKQGFVPNDARMKFWTQSSWTKTKKTSMTFTFNKTEGSVTVLKSGLYYIYAQVHYKTYLNSLDIHVQLNNETLFMCGASGFNGSDVTHNNNTQNASRRANVIGCSTSGLVSLQKGQVVWIYNVMLQPIVLTMTTSFWGLLHIR